MLRVDVRERILAAIAETRRRLRATRPLMLAIGDVLVGASNRAFDEQALGDIRWPERYPGIGRPFISIAGALADWIAGRADPQAAQFRNRPALVVTGALKRSVRASVVDDTTVEIRSDLSYARLHEEGGQSEQTYGVDVKDRIRAWLFERDGKGRQRARAGREGYVQHLNQLIYKNVHRQEVAARPFIGVTDTAEKKIAVAIIAHVGGRR